MAATESTIRAAVYALVNGITDIGVVYDRERWAARWPEFLDYFKTTVSSQDQIRGWTISVIPAIRNGVHVRELHRKEHEIIVRGYLGLDDSASTEKTAAGLAEDVVETLEQYPLLNGTLTNGTFVDEGWPRVVTLEPRMFGGTLCHYIEIRLRVFEKSVVTYAEG